MTCLLFDFDGPIVDLFDARSGLRASGLIVKVGRRFGIHDARGIRSPHFIRLWSEIRTAVARAGRDLAKFDYQVHTAIETLELSMIQTANLDPDSVKMLTTARQYADGVAIVSNNSSRAISSWLSQHGLAHLVDFVSAREERNAFQFLKPSPALVIKAVASLNRRSSQALFVGDTQSDLASSRSAKVKFIGLRTRHSKVGRAGVLISSIWLFGSRADVSRYIQEKLARQDRIHDPAQMGSI